MLQFEPYFVNWVDDKAGSKRNGGKKDKTFFPSVDIKESESSYDVHVELPGVAKEDIDISLDGNVLILKGETKSLHVEEKDGYSSNERVYGAFLRKFTLPDNADKEKIDAKSENGVLLLTIPKLPVEEPKK